jgi:arylsulfatase A-like enzyme
MSPWNHGMLGYSRVAQKYPVEMPRLLRDAGYFTMAIGKLHYHLQRNLHGYHAALLDESGRVESPDFRSDYRSWFWSQAPNLDPDATGVGWNDYKGKAYVLPEELHPPRWTADAAVHFLEGYRRREPFFLKVSFARPHSPYDPPQRWMRRYAGSNIPAPAQASWSERYIQRNTEQDDIWRGRVSADETRTAREAYYGSVSFVDEQIGRVLNALERQRLLEETLIVYTSDHGDMTGDHNLWRKAYAYEPSARIPLLLRWPAGLVSGGRGRVASEPVELRDILATFLDAAGKAPPVPVDGRSLLDLARGKTTGWRTFIDLEHDVCYAPETHWNALTDGKTKYIFHARDGEDMLFDLSSDPLERVNLASEAARSSLLSSWRTRMIEHLSPRGAPFVTGGRLGLRPQSMLHSPNYPDRTGSPPA